MQYLSKFRAFQLDTSGSLFSYYKSNQYTLIEARIPKGGLSVLLDDLAHHEKDRIDVLHITSFDADHCTYDDLVQILNHLRPESVEIPSYIPTTNDGELCRNLILKYDDIHQRYVQNVTIVDEKYIKSLPAAIPKSISNIVCQSMYNCDNKNNMSLVKLFRSSGFNVLSLGDCESSEISARLLTHSIMKNEVDVLILAHHGADNGFTTEEFIKTVNPKLAICSSNYDNMFNHPRPEIRNILFQNGIRLMTTKTGDVVVYQVEGFDYATAVNMIQNNELESSRFGFYPKLSGR